MTTPAKRPAFDAAERLLAPTPYDPSMRRPAATVSGAALVLLRGVVGLLGALRVFGWDGTLDDAGSVIDAIIAVVGAEAGAAVTTTAIVIAVIEVVLAALIFRGSNLARVLVMIVSVIDISVAFGVWLNRGGSFASQGAFVAVAVDILILLALSSRSSAAYARRTERRGTRGKGETTRRRDEDIA